MQLIFKAVFTQLVTVSLLVTCVIASSTPVSSFALLVDVIHHRFTDKLFTQVDTNVVTNAELDHWLATTDAKLTFPTLTLPTLLPTVRL
jgi:hypothetical protein